MQCALKKGEKILALYVKIPKDMDNIKDRFIWKFTKRQVVFLAIGFAIGFAVYWLTYKSLGTQTAIILFFCLACPFFLISAYEDKSTFTFDKIAANIIRHKIFPKIRPYKTENIYRQITEAIEYKEEVEMLETGRKKVKVNKN